MFDFKAPDWFDRYIAFRKANPIHFDWLDPSKLQVSGRQLERFESPQHPLYYLLLNSGLIYGFPFRYPFQPSPGPRLSQRWITRLLLVDILIFSGLPANEPVLPEMLDRAARLLRQYYRGLYSIRAHKDREPTLENILTNEVSFRRSWLDFRKSGINCHLFWDWFFFLDFLEAQGSRSTPVDTDWFIAATERKRQLKLLTMKLVAAAAHSDEHIRSGEKVLQRHFEKASGFWRDWEIREVRQIFRNGISLDELDIPDLPWIARRYLLDVSMLTVFADRKLEPAEEAYLHRLIEKLGLREEELIESKLALGFFLMEYGRKLNFYNGTATSLALISQALTDNFLLLKRAGVMEYRETVDMAETIGRLLKYRLSPGEGKKLPTEDEIAQAFDQLSDLPKFLPFFSIMFLPVPGIVEMYILLAFSIEKLTGNALRLLPSNFSKLIRKKGEGKGGKPKNRKM